MKYFLIFKVVRFQHGSVLTAVAMEE